jgi:hypothetical protein
MAALAKKRTARTVDIIKRLMPQEAQKEQIK